MRQWLTKSSGSKTQGVGVEIAPPQVSTLADKKYPLHRQWGNAALGQPGRSTTPASVCSGFVAPQNPLRSGQEPSNGGACSGVALVAACGESAGECPLFRQDQGCHRVCLG